MKKRIFNSVIGVVLSGIGVAFFKFASFGVDPFQSLMSGLDIIIPISFGTVYVIANAVLLLFSLIFDRHYINIATFINLFLLGYIVDYTLRLFYIIIPEPNILTRAISLIIGFSVLCFGSSLYIVADLGVSPYDAIALIISNKFRLGKFKYIRILTDVTCVIISCTLYYLANKTFNGIFTIIGIGTIFVAAFMGPVVDFINKKITKAQTNN